MKITLNELRRIISANLLTEALSFQKLEELKPEFYVTFCERFSGNVNKFKKLLYKNGKDRENDSVNLNDEQFDDKLTRAYMEYLLVCVIEKGMSFAPISLIANADTTVDTLKFNINNPTDGIKGKYTEFITKILASNLYRINLESEGDMVQGLSVINNFINICEKSASNSYKSKMKFFDEKIMKMLDDKIAEGKIRNFPRPSPQSPLQDKVSKVFEVFGSLNKKNLIRVMLEEFLDESTGQDDSVDTFAGYDLKLIDFCLQNKYWIEMKMNNQPNHYRVFYLNNGNYNKVKHLKKDTNLLSKEEYYEQWIKNFNKRQEKRNLQDLYDDGDAKSIMVDRFDIDGEVFSDAWKYYIESPVSNNVNINFAYRAMIYACNIYPFRTQYNVSKTLMKGGDVSFFKSINNDDYLVEKNNDKYLIRKTTDWCTKDKEMFLSYIGEDRSTPDSKYAGFLLVLNDSLPYDDPDGAVLAGLKLDAFKKNMRMNANGHLISDKKYEVKTYLNANDARCSIPGFLSNYLTGEKNRIELYNTISEYKDYYDKLNQLSLDTLDVNERKEIDASGEKMNAILQKYLKSEEVETKINENKRILLKNYLWYLVE